MTKYIAYEGKRYTVEWYFNENDNSQPKDYHEESTEEQQVALFSIIVSVKHYLILVMIH